MTARVRIAVALALVALLILALWIAGGGSGEESPAPAAERGSPDAPPAESAPSDTSKPAPDPAVATPPAGADPGSRTPESWPLRVRTDTPGAVVTAKFLFAGADADPAPVARTADATGFAGFEIPSALGPLRRIDIDARASGRGAGRVRLYERDPRGVTIRLDPLAVSGVVLGGDGSPLAGARVSLPNGLVVVADASGRFEVFGGWESLEIVVRHDAHLPSTVEVPRPTEGLVVRLERGREVRGRVAFPDGRPVPGVEIQARLDWFVRGETGADGTFALSGLPEGPVRVWCPMLGEERVVEAGGAGADFTVPDHWVRLLVQDEAGRPFRGAAISARGGPFVSDERGVVGVRVPPGERLVAVPGVAGHSRAPTEYTPEGEPRLHEVPVILRPLGAAGTLSIRIVDESGRPRRRAFLSIPEPYGFVEGIRDRPLALGEKGDAVMEGIPPGSWTVRIAGSTTVTPDPEDYAMPFTGPLVMEPGGSVRLDAVLPTGGRIAVTVRDREGEPVIPGTMALRDESGREVRAWFQGVRDGSWSVAHFHRGRVLSFPALAAGRYAVEARPEGVEPVVREVVVAAGKTAEVEILLDR